MQTIKAYFENQEARILAYVVGFGNIGYNQGVAVYSTPVSLYSGTNNPIKIQCLNSDQKRINVSNVTVQLGVFQPGTQNELIVKTATNVDSANGVIETILTSSDLAPLDFGQYEIALVAVDEFNNAYPVYINDYYGSRLPTSLSKGPVLAYPDPIPVVWTDQSGIGVCSSYHKRHKCWLCGLYLFKHSYTANRLWPSSTRRYQHLCNSENTNDGRYTPISFLSSSHVCACGNGSERASHNNTIREPLK